MLNKHISFILDVICKNYHCKFISKNYHCKFISKNYYISRYTYYTNYVHNLYNKIVILHKKYVLLLMYYYLLINIHKKFNIRR